MTPLGKDFQKEQVRVRDPWPEGVSDGLTLPCSDCGQVPRFDYTVKDAHWHAYVHGPASLGVICLPCLDRRCRGIGLADSLVSIQWTGTGHTVVCVPTLRYEYGLAPSTAQEQEPT